LQRAVRKTRDAGLRTRSLIILHAAAGKSSGAIAEAIGYDPAVLKVIHRFLAEGEEGLRDHRVDNGQPKVDEPLREALCGVVARSPQDYGWARPTWTQELLARQLTAMTGVRVSETTVGRMLAERGIRWGMARPTVACPWTARAQRRRLRAIKRRLATLRPGEEAFYEDEVDIHLNPRIGRDWMLPGTQKEVLTPGQNQKHYLAGARPGRPGRDGPGPRRWTTLSAAAASSTRRSASPCSSARVTFLVNSPAGSCRFGQRRTLQVSTFPSRRTLA
jgi:transposase